MSTKRQKKSSGKYKQNGKKSSKNTVVEKSKYEIENCAKDQITELEKEMFSIKISEMERKLARKKQMCLVIEEERNLYESLYEEKKVLKRESMKLLNNIYEEFSNEIFLLDHELHAMNISYEEILKGREFCIDRKEKVKTLSSMESLLEAKLAEAEQGTKDIVELNSKLSILQDEVLVQERKFKSTSQDLMSEFSAFLSRMLEDLVATVNRIIQDKSLKLEFLPVFYQALFISGALGTHWLNSTLEHCEFHLLQNVEIGKNLVEADVRRKMSESIFKRSLFDINTTLQIEDFMNHWNKELKNSGIEQKPLSEAVISQDPNLQFMPMNYEKLLVLYEDKIKKLKKKIEELEKEINLQEVSDEKIKENAALAEKVNVAVDIIQREI